LKPGMEKALTSGLPSYAWKHLTLMDTLPQWSPGITLPHYHTPTWNTLPHYHLEHSGHTTTVVTWNTLPHYHLEHSGLATTVVTWNQGCRRHQRVAVLPFAKPSSLCHASTGAVTDTFHIAHVVSHLSHALALLHTKTIQNRNEAHDGL